MRSKNLLYLVGLILYISGLYSVIFFFEDQKIIFLTREDGFFETLTAIFFLITSIFFFIKFHKEKTGNDFLFLKTKKNYFFLILGIVFFLGFGEEISWGQRIVNIETPETLKKINTQNEINIHNLIIFDKTDAEGQSKSFLAKFWNIERLFSLFWFFYCVLIPVFEKYSLAISRWLKKIHLPVIPIWLGIFFMANHLISKIIELMVAANLDQPIVEIKECNYAFLFLLAGFSFLSLSQSDGKS